MFVIAGECNSHSIFESYSHCSHLLVPFLIIARFGPIGLDNKFIADFVDLRKASLHAKWRQEKLESSSGCFRHI